MDSLGRFGGDEWIVILRGADGVAACGVARRMLQAVRNLRNEVADMPTISVGVAAFP